MEFTIDDMLDFFSFWAAFGNTKPLDIFGASDVLFDAMPDDADRNNWENAVVGTVFLASQMGSAYLNTAVGKLVVVFDDDDYFILRYELVTAPEVSQEDLESSEVLLIDTE